MLLLSEYIPDYIPKKNPKLWKTHDDLRLIIDV
jgi:hypothetical protein